MKYPLFNFVQTLALLASVFIAGPAHAVNLADAQKAAAVMNCQVAIGSAPKENATQVYPRFLCIGAKVTDAGTDQELRGCGITLNDALQKTTVSLAGLNTAVNTDTILINEPCSAKVVARLMSVPVDDGKTVTDLGRALVTSSTSLTLLREIIPFQKSLAEMKIPAKDTTATLTVIQGNEDQNKPVRHHTVQIFYATSRKGVSGNNGTVYSGERALGNRLSLGSVNVSIPNSHQTGELESPGLFSAILKVNPDKQILVESVNQIAYQDYYSQVKNKVFSSNKKDLFVFVHGYNVTFEDAARRTAQIAWDMKFEGAPILYSWASKGSIFSYPADEATADVNGVPLAYFLLDIVRKSGAERIHLIAHSMGNRVLTAALDELDKMRILPNKTFQQIVLAAPDIDVDKFNQLAIAVKSNAERVTIYESKNDVALKASNAFHAFSRVGLVNVVVPGIDTVDASDTDTSVFSLKHSYFGDTSQVVCDIKALVEFARPPEKRSYLDKENSDEGTYWYLTKGATWSACPM